MRRRQHRYRHGVPPATLRALEAILQSGAAKYGEPAPLAWPNQVQPAVAWHLGAALRHLGRAGITGKEVDCETGLPHLLHAAARLILLHTLLTDQPLTPSKETK